MFEAFAHWWTHYVGTRPFWEDFFDDAFFLLFAIIVLAFLVPTIHAFTQDRKWRPIRRAIAETCSIFTSGLVRDVQLFAGEEGRRRHQPLDDFIDDVRARWQECLSRIDLLNSSLSPELALELMMFVERIEYTMQGMVKDLALRDYRPQSGPSPTLQAEQGRSWERSFEDRQNGSRRPILFHLPDALVRVEDAKRRLGKWTAFARGARPASTLRLDIDLLLRGLWEPAYRRWQAAR